MEKRTRVLLADANEEFRILLRQLLEETGEFMEGVRRPEFQTSARPRRR